MPDAVCFHLCVQQGVTDQYLPLGYVSRRLSWVRRIAAVFVSSGVHPRVRVMVVVDGEPRWVETYFLLSCGELAVYDAESGSLMVLDSAGDALDGLLEESTTGYRRPSVYRGAL